MNNSSWPLTPSLRHEVIYRFFFVLTTLHIRCLAKSRLQADGFWPQGFVVSGKGGRPSHGNARQAQTAGTCPLSLGVVQ